MLEATVLGSASTPGQLLYSRSDAGPSREPLSRFHSFFQDQHQHESHRPLGRTLQSIENDDDGTNDECSEEELVWYGKSVVWSRGNEVYRRYTYEQEKEDVSKAVFVWFKSGDQNTQSYHNKGKQPINKPNSLDGTFGPFHTSQHENWGIPRLSPSSGSNRPRLERTLLVFLQTRAHVYFFSGEDALINLPFVIDDAWPISGGGVMVQRALEKRELRKLGQDKISSGSVLRGMMDQTSMTILDDLIDLEDDNAPPAPRLYTLGNPFDEFRMVTEGKVEDGYGEKQGRIISQIHSISCSSSILHISPGPYPFIIVYDCQSNEIVFYRQTKIPDLPDLPDQPVLPFNPRTAKPEDILRPPEPPIPQVPPRPGRPSLHRNMSSFGPTTDRRLSGISDPLDRTQRRAPRMSRGLAQEPPIPTDDLQAALDPIPSIPPATTTKRKSRGMSVLSTVTSVQDAHRRTSGSNTSFMIHDLHDKQGKMGLQAVADLDLRETTMMMGLERDEVGKRSDIVLSRIWSWKVPNAVEVEDISVFLSDDHSPSSVTINIHVIHSQHGSRLYRFDARLRSTHYPDYAITPASVIDCLSAIPVISTRHRIRDILILSPTGSLSLLTSGGRPIAFKIPSDTTEGHEDVTRKLAASLRVASEGRHGRMNTERKIVKLIDAIGPRFTVIFEDGESVRVSADLLIKHQLTKQCIEALSCVLPAQEFFYFKREFLATLQTLPNSLRNARPETWKVFANTVRNMLQIDVEPPAKTPFEAVLTNGQSSSDPIARRLAQRLCQQRSTSSHLTGAQLICGETLRTSDAAPVLLALHLVAQDLRLVSTRSSEIEDLVKLISDLASEIGRGDWKDYWFRILPLEMTHIKSTQEVKYDTSLLDRFDAPPDILTYLSRQLVTRTKPFPSFSSLPLLFNQISELGLVNPCRQTELLTSIYSYFSADETISTKAARIVRYIVQAGLDDKWISDLPYGIALPIWEMIRVCQYNPPRNWNARMYEMVGRWDLGIRAIGGETKNIRDDSTLDLGPERIPTIKELMCSDEETTNKKKSHQPTLPHVRFGSDRRVQEVERIMQTTRVRTLSIQDPKGASEADIVRYHQTVVNTIANRTLSIPVGQGMFEFGTRSTNITDIWNIPLIELSVKVGPGKPLLKAEIVSDSAEWPCFHNGVAAGLAISPECKGIDSSWIVFNRPNVLNAEHGGFLLGLGLTGHLKSLTTYHAYPLMEPRHDFTSVGLLLGLACSYAGSEDLLVTKVLSLHTHALLPMGSMELNASPIIQSSALVGLGLVYAGSKNLRMAEVALNEVGRKEMVNVDGFADYQESYSFSAAMAFGLIMLGRGGKTTSEVDRRMLTQLRRCIIGDISVTQASKNRNTASNIDNNLTGPGATLALGLMYLKTGRKDIADMISIPQTTFDLDQVRPDLLLLRIFARSLILWDEITPTMGWIEDQLPSFIRSANKGHKRNNNMELATELAYLNIVSGACFAIGIKYAGTATELAHNNLMTFFGVLSRAATGQSMTYEGRIRRTAARQGLNVVTLALAMVMSGTGELSVLRRLRVSHGQEGAGVTYGSHMAMHMALGMLFLGRGHYTLGNSNLAIAVMSISFFPRFLNSPGDNKSYPQAFRHLWALAVEPRCLIAKDIDTLETVYLPVKLRLKENTIIRQQSLISPTLISPFENIVSIEVDSPRYWPITYDLSNTNSQDKWNLIKTRTIYVKRKLGFLDYNSDPKGNRSIFVRAGSMTGIDLHYDLISHSSPPTINSLEAQNLIKAHSGQSNLISLSKLFNHHSNQLDEFIRTISLECLSLDKPHLISIYLSMFMTLKKDGSIEDLNQLGFMKSFYSDIYDKTFASSGSGSGSGSSSNAEKRFALIRPSFVSSLLRSLTSTSSENEESIIASYLTEDSTPSSEEIGNKDGKSLSRWILKNRVPPLPLLQLMRNKVRQSAIDRDVLELKIRDVAEVYRRRIEGGYDEDQGINLGQGGWKVESVRQAIKLWTE
ncbi:uncharacterized protein IL334_005359 [Kwoniella shivajii]|uniref:Anaphase-promoting complex subunit 1 n=1 Tax=Kwoniella shivajii TaxID=564305 RepID=A0ABZ1D3L0_9TREE|nr:hypothetical protein IL334_005359 [Kwoniella shivajii]